MKFPITAQRLREALNNNRMKPQELADLSGVNKASISQYVNGSHTPSNISAGKMAPFLHVSPLWLMGFDVDKISEIGNAETVEKTDEKKALEMYEKYTKADPSIKAAIETLLRGKEED